MKLYKMKSFQEDGLLHALDMIISKRIYLSTCDYVNDIDEGSWNYTDHKDNSFLEIANSVRAIVDAQRFTCFLKSINNPLMWAHYAGGFSGIAIKYNFDQRELDVRKMKYDGVPGLSIEQMKSISTGECSPQDAGILRSKAKCWYYEDEWRLYGKGEDEYIEGIKPDAIIFGGRQNKYVSVVREVARKFDVRVGYLNPTRSMDYKVVYT